MKNFLFFLKKLQPDPRPSNSPANRLTSRMREMSLVFTAGRLPGVINPECPVPVK